MGNAEPIKEAGRKSKQKNALANANGDEETRRSTQEKSGPESRTERTCRTRHAACVC
jgi:hypothetical protein